jgi:hypothetical protein
MQTQGYTIMLLILVIRLNQTLISYKWQNWWQRVKEPRRPTDRTALPILFQGNFGFKNFWTTIWKCKGEVWHGMGTAWARHVMCELAFSILCDAAPTSAVPAPANPCDIIYLNKYSILHSSVHMQNYIINVNILCLHPTSHTHARAHTHASFITSSAESTCSSVLEPSSCFRSLDGVVPPLLLLYDSFSGWPWKWQIQNECTHRVTTADFMLKKSSVMIRYHFITQHIPNTLITGYKMFVQLLYFF